MVSKAVVRTAIRTALTGLANRVAIQVIEMANMVIRIVLKVVMDSSPKVIDLAVA